MTEAEYIAQNELGFEGDTFLKDEFQKLIDLFKIETIVETGTYRGSTTVQLAKMVKKVISIEVKKENYLIAKEKTKNIPEVNLFLGNSSELLPDILNHDDVKNKNLFFFLDAHWESYNPLIDELKVIAKAGLKPLIAIHDFKVPGTDLGFDSYAGQDYDLDWIKKELDNIYGENDYSYHYNTNATGARRGVIFIYHRYHYIP
jgi:predicted O-methyltransferase YrrM